MTQDAFLTIPSLLTFFKVATHALIRAETNGRVPERFTGNGPQRWEQFANELTRVDLLDLAIQDAAQAYPIPFGLRRDLPGYENGGALIDPDAVSQIIKDALDQVEVPQRKYVQRQAERLGINVIPDADLEALPDPEPHHTILELPGTGGWLAYKILSEENSRVYFWENFTVTCASWQEVMLAGLVAFELDAPPNKPLFIYQDEPLRTLMDKDKRYDWVIGSQSHNAHRALELFANQKDRIVLV